MKEKSRRHKLLSAIFAEAKKQGIPPEDLREIMAKQVIRKRLSRANDFELMRMLDHLKGGRSCTLCRPRRSREKLPENITLLVSRQQLDYIAHLAEDIHWQYPDGFQRWLRNHMGIERIRTSLEASKVIEGLKNILKQQSCKGRQCAAGR